MFRVEYMIEADEEALEEYEIEEAASVKRKLNEDEESLKKAKIPKN